MTDFTTPHDVRLACRRNELDIFAARALRGYLCVNVIFLPAHLADDFAAFCRRNPKPCPLLKQLPPGQTDADDFAVDLDLRTDLGSYDLLRDGAVVEQRTDITDLFNDDTVTFLIGSSVSFDGLLIKKGYGPVYGSVLYHTEVDCEPVGPLHGKTVVTMRAFKPGQADFVEEYTSHFPQCHGAPMGRNNAAELGIDLSIDFRGNATEIPPDTDLIFWACGVTPSLVLQTSNIPEAITYTPGHALITDIPTEQLYLDDPAAWYAEAVAQ